MPADFDTHSPGSIPIHTNEKERGISPMISPAPAFSSARRRRPQTVTSNGLGSPATSMHPLGHAVLIEQPYVQSM
jgi:hypothetical protein